MLASLPALKFNIQGNIFIDTRFPARDFFMLDFRTGESTFLCDLIFKHHFILKVSCFKVI